MLIERAKKVRGAITVPGDKSISHRAALIAALASGVSRISNYSTSRDCAATLSCLRQLGVPVTSSGNQVTIEGRHIRGMREPYQPLDCRNSGTTMRLLAGILAGQNFTSILTGDRSLSGRPMQRIIEPLEMMGAVISSNGGNAPLTIRGSSRLRAIRYELLMASAQVKSCILLAGLHAEGHTQVVENEPTRDHTERILRWFNVPVEAGPADREPATAQAIGVRGPAVLEGRDVSIPGDVSSAAYFIAAAAMIPGSSLEIRGLGLNPNRIAFIDKLRELGFAIETTDAGEISNEPIGTVRVSGQSQPTNTETLCKIGGLEIPKLIDELPLLAVIGSQVRGGIEIRDAAELRLKESDRIAATVAGLQAMGAEVREFDDGLRVTGPAKLRGAKIDSRSDHRIAMTFAVAGMIADGGTEIMGADCVAVSFPEFFPLLSSVVEKESKSRLATQPLKV